MRQFATWANFFGSHCFSLPPAPADMPTRYLYGPDILDIKSVAFFSATSEKPRCFVVSEDMIPSGSRAFNLSRGAYFSISYGKVLINFWIILYGRVTS